MGRIDILFETVEHLLQVDPDISGSDILATPTLEIFGRPAANFLSGHNT